MFEGEQYEKEMDYNTRYSVSTDSDSRNSFCSPGKRQCAECFTDSSCPEPMHKRRLYEYRLWRNELHDDRNSSGCLYERRQCELWRFELQLRKLWRNSTADSAARPQLSEQRRFSLQSGRKSNACTGTSRLKSRIKRSDGNNRFYLLWIHFIK